MSLRSSYRSPDTVVVILRENREGDRGHLVPVEVGRVVRHGRLQESTADDVQTVLAAGVTDQRVLSLKTFICADFPGDDLAQVEDAAGVVYDVVGEPKRMRGSRRTHRDVVRLKSTGVVRGLRG